MTSRFTQDSFTTASVGAGATLDIDRIMPDNGIDIFRIKITPNSAGGTAEFFIHKTSARADADLIYATAPWTQSHTVPFYDPVEERGANYFGRNESFVCHYEDLDVSLHMHLRIKNNDSGAHTYAIAITYAVTIYAIVAANKPDGLAAALQFDGLMGHSSCIAAYNNSTVIEGEFRAMYVDPSTVLPAYVDMRTPAEGGSFVHDGVTQLIITGLRATYRGCSYLFRSFAQGRWYFAWRLKDTYGWSNWTDGNPTPALVYQYADTMTASDAGPPADWEVTLCPGSVPNTYVASASRPRTNGNCILFFWAQFKDADTGSWRALDANAGVAVTYYDGSGVNHNYDPATGEFSNGGAGWGTASIGDLILVDVRGNGTFDADHCTWATLDTLSTTIGTDGSDRFQATAHKTGDIFDQVRIKIVKPPWLWNTEGYLGAEANHGIWNENSPGSNWIYGNYSARSFQTGPVQVPDTVTNVEVRVWFENWYSRSDGGLIHSTSFMGITSDYVEGDHTWTQFNDPNWWIPTIQGGDVTLTMLADATVKGSAGSASGNQYGYVGPAARFRIFPSRAEGEIQLRAKWSVLFTNGSGGCPNAGGVGILFQLPAHGMMYYGYDTMLPGLVLRHKENGGSHLVDFEIGLGINTPLDSSATPSAISTSAKVTIPNASIPTMPCDVELRLWIKKDPTDKQAIFSVAEYQLGGGGWNTITQTAIVRRCAGVHMFGIRPFPIYYQSASGVGSYATLTQFEVIKGICTRY
jgi:hypothetical protein